MEEKLQQQAYNKLLAYLFLNGADKTRSGKLIEDLANQYAMGYQNYPTDLAAASAMILGYQNRVNNPNYSPNQKKSIDNNSTQEENKVAFAQKHEKRI